MLKGKRDYAAARKLLQDSGYNGEKIVLLGATDVAPLKAQADVTADLLARVSAYVDYQAMNWGTITAWRASMRPPSEGEWNISHTWSTRADASSPPTYPHLYCNGKTSWFGWPTSAPVQAEIAKWYDAPNLAAEQRVAKDLNAALIEASERCRSSRPGSTWATRRPAPA